MEPNLVMNEFDKLNEPAIQSNVIGQPNGNLSPVAMRPHSSPFAFIQGNDFSPLSNSGQEYSSNSAKMIHYDTPKQHAEAQDMELLESNEKITREDIQQMQKNQTMNSNIRSAGENLVCQGHIIKQLNPARDARVHSGEILLEINQVPRKKFNNFPVTCRSAPEISSDSMQNPPFYLMKSSQIQQFNSFAPHALFLQHTIGQKSLVVSPNTENQAVERNVCCSCKKSHCLKLYCECFSHKMMCQGCGCVNCRNVEENNEEREKAMQDTLERNRNAFIPKFSAIKSTV
jgi:hypothetical protein